MNHDKARQRQADKLWHYTTHNDRGGTWPTGYCADGCPGHATAEEACAHQKQYLLDRATFTDDNAAPRQLNRCEVEGCQRMTDGHASLPGGETHMLCASHRNRDTLEKIIDVGESWHS